MCVLLGVPSPSRLRLPGVAHGGTPSRTTALAGVCSIRWPLPGRRRPKSLLELPGDAGEDLWSSPSGSPSQRWRGVHYGESWSQEMINRCRAKIDVAATQTKNPAGAGFLAGRSGVIRTLDPHVPNVVRYQTALHSVTSGASIEQPIWLHKHQIPKSRRIF